MSTEIETHDPPPDIPVVVRFQNSSRGGRFFAPPNRFPVPASIVALGKDESAAAGCSIVGCEIGDASLLGDIYETARTSIAPPIAPDAPSTAMFRLVLAEARRLVPQRNAIERMAAEPLSRLAASAQCTAIPAISVGVAKPTPRAMRLSDGRTSGGMARTAWRAWRRV